MKKTVSIILSVLILISSIVPCVSAQFEEKTSYDDGSYLVITENCAIEEETEFFSFFAKIMDFFKKIIELLKTNKTVTKTKYANYYSSQGVLLWSVYLEAEFIYNGKSVVCTSSKISYIISDSDWKLLSNSQSKKDNTATGTFVIKQYKLGVPLKEISKTLILTCDKNGNVT